MKILTWSIALLMLCGCNQAQPAQPAQAKTKSYPNGLTAPEVFSLRTKCAEMVDKQEPLLGAVGKALTSQVWSHYNPDTNRCYAEVMVTKNFNFDYKEHPVPDNYRTTSISDAQTKNLMVLASQQQGRVSYGSDFTNQAGSNVTYEQALARIAELMQEDAQ